MDNHSTPSSVGSWIATYPQCANATSITDAVQVLQICWCIICACQTLFFATRWPVVSSELVLVPAVETLVYGLGFANVGYIQLMDGRFVCWVRHGSWLLTCPMILFQVCQLSHVRWLGLDMNTLLIIVCEIMLVFGFSSSVSSNIGVKWMFFCFGVICIVFVFAVAFIIFRNASRRFLDRGTYEAKKIAERIHILALCFFVSWSSYPVLYILSAEGACVASERVIVVLYIVADGFAKNVFGLIFWETSWNHLRGTWASEMITGFQYAESAAQVPKTPGSYELGLGERNVRDVTADLKMQPRVRSHEPLSNIRIADRISPVRESVKPFFGLETNISERLQPQKLKMTGIGVSPNEPFPGYYHAAIEPEFENVTRTTSQDIRSPSTVFQPQTSQASPSQNIEDVVDHVRSLNQALCDLLANEAGKKKPDQQVAAANGTYGALPQQETFGQVQDRMNRTSMTFLSPISSNAGGFRGGRAASATVPGYNAPNRP